MSKENSPIYYFENMLFIIDGKISSEGSKLPSTDIAGNEIDWSLIREIRMTKITVIQESMYYPNRPVNVSHYNVEANVHFRSAYKKPVVQIRYSTDELIFNKVVFDESVSINVKIIQ